MVDEVTGNSFKARLDTFYASYKSQYCSLNFRVFKEYFSRWLTTRVIFMSIKLKDKLKLCGAYCQSKTADLLSCARDL